MSAMKRLHADLEEDIREIPCDACGGEGTEVEQYGPGRAVGFGFVPDERLVPCRECGGAGSTLELVHALPMLNREWTPENPHAPGDESPLPF